MIHLGTKTLETQRLLLRQFVADDAQAMYCNWANDAAVTKFLAWPPHADVQATRAVLELWIADYAKPEFYQWAIVPKDLGEPIGSISVVSANDEVASIEIGYCIGTKWWHQGIVSEALAELLRYFFTEVGMNRIAAKHDLRNPHSGNVMKKCGMKYEGTLRQSDTSNAGVADMAVYSILAQEYL